MEDLAQLPGLGGISNSLPHYPLFTSTLFNPSQALTLPVPGEEGLKTSVHEMDTAKLKWLLSSYWCSATWS